MPNTMTPGVLRCGLLDTAFYRDCGPSMTAHQPLPAGFEYAFGETDPAAVDCVIATQGSGQRLATISHPRRVYWLQERRDFQTEPDIDLAAYDLVLTNDRAVLEACPHARWVSHVGTWLAASEMAEAAPKPHETSFIASGKRAAPGHLIRHEVKSIVMGMAALPAADCYGGLFDRAISTKQPALVPYKFSITIESDAYAWFYTEKLFDCFAARTIPLYWGPPLDRLHALGFRLGGIIPWHTIAGLRDYLDLIHAHPDEWYADRAPAIEHNYRRICELPAAEVLVGQAIREHFGLSA